MPNVRALYGNAREVITIPTSCGSGFLSLSCKFSNVLYITQTNIKALDQPTQRCRKGNLTSLKTSACIAAFVNKQVGCNTKILGSQYSNTPPCTTKSQLLALANISRMLDEADENDIYEMTGCLSSCEKDSYTLSADPLETNTATVYNGDIPCELHLQFRMMHTSYEEKEQYIIYDVDSFIADVGGYMGLLLGSSLLSLYKVLETIMRKVLCRPFKGNTGI